MNKKTLQCIVGHLSLSLGNEKKNPKFPVVYSSVCCTLCKCFKQLYLQYTNHAWSHIKTEPVSEAICINTSINSLLSFSRCTTILNSH